MTPGTAVFDEKNIIGVTFDYTPTYFTTSRPGYSANQDIGTIFQTKYFSVFYLDTLLCAPAAPTSGYIRLTSDISNWFSKFNSVYASLSTLNVTAFTTSGSGVTQTKTTSSSIVATAKYGTQAQVASPPYTYQWSVIGTYGATVYPVNANTTILTPTSSSTLVRQVQGAAYTKQMVQCVITDASGRIGYSIACVLNFI